MEPTDEFERLLRELAADDPADATLYGLSNLHGSELERLAEVWPTLPEERRQHVAERLVEISEDDFEMDFCELFKIGLTDANAAVRTASIEGLWEVEDSILVRPMVHILRDDVSIPVREAAAMALSRFALMAELGRLQPRPAQLVWDALWDAIHSAGEDLSVRRRAVESLAFYDRPEVADVIRTAYEDEEPKMRISAVFAMGRTADAEWAVQVLAELDDDDPEMRYEAVRAAGELRLIEATQALSQLVADTDAEVRLAAVWALGQLGTPEARRVLEICADQGDEALQDAADDALAMLEFLQGDIDFALYDFEPDEDEDVAWEDEEDDIYWPDEDEVE